MSDATAAHPQPKLSLFCSRYQTSLPTTYSRSPPNTLKEFGGDRPSDHCAPGMKGRPSFATGTRVLFDRCIPAQWCSPFQGVALVRRRVSIVYVTPEGAFPPQARCFSHRGRHRMRRSLSSSRQDAPPPRSACTPRLISSAQRSHPVACVLQYLSSPASTPPSLNLPTRIPTV